MAGIRKKRAGGNVRPRQGERLSKLLITLVAVTVVLFAAVVGFRVTTFEVIGNSAYTDEEVMEAAGVELGENIVLLHKSNIASAILTDLPYVESVRVTRILPGTVRVELTEGTAAAAIQSEYGDWWLVSSAGKLMEQIDEETAALWPQITGATAQLPEEGDMLRLDSGGDALPELLAALEDTGIDGVTIIDWSDENALVLWIGEQYKVELGTTDRLTYKIQFLSSVLENLGEDYTGLIDLSFSEDEAAHFHPW